MNKIIIFIFCIVIMSCSSNDELSEEQPLEGRQYQLTSLEIEVPLDLNNDGVFSINLLEEDNLGCLEMNTLSFGRNGIDPIIEYITYVSINEETIMYNENFGCGILDYFVGFEYVVEEENVYIFEEGTTFNPESSTRGLLEGNEIMFSLPWLRDYIGLENIITEEGNIIPYNGSITLRYLLQ